MSSAGEGMILTAGTLSLIGNGVRSGGFPENGVGIIAATSVLAFIAAMSKSTPFAPVMRAMAVLLLLAAVYAYIPGLVKQTKHKKGVKNG